MSVSLDLGLALATRSLAIQVADGFIYVSGRDADQVTAPSTLSGLVTVVVEIASGGFVIAVESGDTTVCDGQDLAALLAEEVAPGTDLRLWLRWPEDAAARARLGRNLWELAESAGSVVWSPPEGGDVNVVAGCLDLGSSFLGEPVPWDAYHPRPQRRLRFQSDADGRLVPTGGLTFVSRPEDDGSFTMHMPVLDDGRLAAFCADGSRYALGPRQLHQLLDECGWRGEQIVLGDEVGSTPATLLADYLNDVGDALGESLPINVRLVAAGAPDELLRLVSTLVAELPSLQVRCRASVCADPAGATDLLTAWYDFHLQLVEARHVPAIRNAWATWSTMDDDATDSERIDALVRTHALDRAWQLVVKHLDTGEPPLTPRGTGSVIDARWDGHLRMVSNIALAHLDPINPDQARQMRALAQAIATLATASGSDGPSSLAQPAVQLRLYLERLAAGADDIGFEPPIAIPVPTTDAEPELDPYEERFGPDPTQTVEWTRSSVFLARPRLVRAARNTKPHGLSWLPQAVQVNEHEFEVYVESGWPASQAATSGIPSARMFLVGHLDRSPTPTAHEVRIRVGRYGAVDVPATGVEPPTALRSEVSANDAYVLPAAWLDRCHIVLDRGELDDGEVGAATPATMWCSGAVHGIEGLPDIGTAPPRVFGRSVRAYAFVPEVGNVVSWVRLYQRPPRSAHGRLVELRVGHRHVIDLVRLSARLAALPAVRTILPDLRAQGARLILPQAEFKRALATRVLAADGGRWQPQPVRRGLTFADLIAVPVDSLSTTP